MRPTLIARLAVTITCAAAGASAAPSPVSFIDAANFQVSQQPAATLLTLGDRYDVRLAQTLTVEIGGTATGVYLPVYCPTTGALIVQLRDASSAVPGSGTILAEGRLLAPTQPWYLQRNFVLIPFRTPASVGGPGTPLSLYVAAKGGECYLAMAPANSDYAGGHGFYRTVFTGGVFYPLAPGSYGDDIPFMLEMEP